MNKTKQIRLTKNVGRKLHESCRDNTVVGFNFGSGMAGMSIRERGDKTFLKKWTYNDSSIRKSYNENTRAKLKQQDKDLKNKVNLEDIQLPQNGEHKKMSDYAWFF